jgi:hypothetical protein
MTVQTVKLGGKSFVIVPEKDFRRLQERAEEIKEQDRADAVESRRRMRERGGKSLAQVRTLTASAHFREQRLRRILHRDGRPATGQLEATGAAATPAGAG